MITVFYDGKCGLCAREIAYYQRMAPENIFRWEDITRSQKLLKQHNISLVEGLMFLHVLDHKGKLHKGLEAFIIIWQHLEKWRHLARVLSLPGVRHLASVCYTGFARWRFNRLEHCQQAKKKEGEK